MYLTTEKQKEVLSRGKDINIWVSDRSGRKSSVTQETLFYEALEGRPFILLRNKKDEIISESWLSEYVSEKFKDYIFFTEKINSNIVVIKVKTPNDEVFIYCYGLYVSLSQKYKSNYYDGFESVRYVVWEECIPNTPLLQNIKHIRARCMTEIYNVLSITSTIARDNKVQLIWLGNDIKENILNPITITFNLLERLSPNLEIEESVVLNDREYSFYFNYFDFAGAVNHWLFNENLHIKSTIDDIDIDKMVKYDIIIKTDFKTYYIYNCGSYMYITDYDYDSQTVNSGISTVKDFFKKYNALHLYNDYKIEVALTMLCTFYGVPFRIVNQYFGNKWYKGEIEFNPDEVYDNTVFIELEKILSFSLADIMNLRCYEDLKNLNEMKKSCTFIYSNIKIMMLFEELNSILMFT